MNKLEDLIRFVNEIKANEHSELRKCMGNLGFSIEKMRPHLARIDKFGDIASALIVFKDILDHLKADVDTSDHDYCDIIVGVDYKLEFDNKDIEELDKALELLDWFDNEHVYPEDMEDEKEWILKLNLLLCFSFY